MVSAGIKELFIAAGGASFPTDYAQIYGMGVRNNGSFVISHQDPITDKDGRKFPNLVNFRAEVETMQIDDADLIMAVINGTKNGSISAALLTSGLAVSGTQGAQTVGSATGGIYLFDGSSPDNSLGIDFEMNFGLKARVMKLILERAFKYGSSAGEALKILDDAASKTIAYSAGKIPEIDESKVIDGFVSPSFIPSGLSTAFADINLVDFNINLKNVFTKSGMNVSLSRGVKVIMNATAHGLDADTVHDLITYEFLTTDISITIGTATLVFKGKGLSRVGEAQLNDEKREGTFTYEGTYDLDFVRQNSNTITFNTFLVP